MESIRNILNSRFKRNGNFFMALTKILGFKPKDIKYYQKAFTHRSMNIKDPKGDPFNYERLEFLGDAMLSSVIASHLYLEVPSGDEGYLTKMRSKVVSREHLNELGKELKLIISDNGVGFEAENIRDDSFGTTMIKALTRQLKGKLITDSHNGTNSTLILPNK